MKLFFQWLGIVAAIFVGAVALNRCAEAQTACPSGDVAGDAARVCWRNATQDVNGNALPASGTGSLVQTRIQRSTGADCESNFGTPVETINVTADVGVVLFENLPAGRWCYRARHLADNGSGSFLWSAWTPTVSKVSTVEVGRPQGPLMITVE